MCAISSVESLVKSPLCFTKGRWWDAIWMAEGSISQAIASRGSPTSWWMAKIPAPMPSKTESTITCCPWVVNLGVKDNEIDVDPDCTGWSGTTGDGSSPVAPGCPYLAGRSQPWDSLVGCCCWDEDLDHHGPCWPCCQCPWGDAHRSRWGYGDRLYIGPFSFLTLGVLTLTSNRRRVNRRRLLLVREDVLQHHLIEFVDILHHRLGGFMEL